MDVKHLDRANKIVEGIAWCRKALSFEGPSPTASCSLTLSRPRPGNTQPLVENYWLSRDVQEIAFKAWRREVELREAKYRREAAQIGLKLED